MTKSEIFKKAHANAKKIVSAVGDYVIALSLSLKEVYKSMKNEINVEKLKSIGCEWAAGSHHRIYFNDLADLAGFVINRYKTGNLMSVSWARGSLSNNKANSMIPDFSSKVWFDVNKGEFNSKNIHSDVFDVIVEKLKNI